VSSHKDFTVVFVQSTLGVSDSRHILDDHGVIGVFSFLVQNIVCLDHIINNIALANLFASESLLLVQVLAICKRKSAAVQEVFFKRK
jgi:ammonia channel protein AmtB